MFKIRKPYFLKRALEVTRFSHELSVGSVVKNLPANGGDAGDMSSIPGSGRALQEHMATCSSVLAWRILWTEDPGCLQSTGSCHKESDMTEAIEHACRLSHGYSHFSFRIVLPASLGLIMATWLAFPSEMWWKVACITLGWKLYGYMSHFLLL